MADQLLGRAGEARRDDGSAERVAITPRTLKIMFRSGLWTRLDDELALHFDEAEEEYVWPEVLPRVVRAIRELMLSAEISVGVRRNLEELISFCDEAAREGAGVIFTL